MIVFFTVRNIKFAIKTLWRWNLIPLLLGCLVQILYYKVSGHVAQKTWYWIPEMLFIILLFGMILEIFVREINKLPNGDQLIPLSALVTIFLLAIPYLKIPYEVINYIPENEHFYLLRTHWIEENTAQNSRIGMTGSGSSGYFLQDRIVINLDGLISSQEYFVHLQKSTADEYLESINLDYIFGNAYILQHTNPYQWNFENRLEEYRYFNVDDKTLTLFKFITD
jgi:hypothetical protein